MPVRGMLRQPGQRGFTLLEVLVVVLLVGLLAGLAGLAQVDSGGQQARRETERLRSLFGLLRQDALLSQRDYGLRIERRGYSVQVLDLDGEWRPAPGYRPQTLPENLRLNLEAGADAPTPGRSRRSRAPPVAGAVQRRDHALQPAPGVPRPAAVRAVQRRSRGGPR